jgi:hypothetical protein
MQDQQPVNTHNWNNSVASKIYLGRGFTVGCRGEGRHRVAGRGRGYGLLPRVAGVSPNFAFFKMTLTLQFSHSIQIRTVPNAVACSDAKAPRVSCQPEKVPANAKGNTEEEEEVVDQK